MTNFSVLSFTDAAPQCIQFILYSTYVKNEISALSSISIPSQLELPLGSQNKRPGAFYGRFFILKRMLSITFRVTLQLSDKQYEWTALSARAKIKQWRGLEQIFTAKVCIWFNKRYSLMRFCGRVDCLNPLMYSFCFSRPGERAVFN